MHWCRWFYGRHTARPDHYKRCQPFFDLITGRMPQSGKLPVLNLLAGKKIRFFAPKCDSLHRFTSNMACPTGTRVTWLYIISRQPAQGVGMRPKNIENFHFLKNSRLTGANPFTDFECFRFFYTTTYPPLTFQI